MKKTISLFLVALLLMLSLSACDPNNGTYYLYKDGNLDEAYYIVLDGDQWHNDGGMEGRYEIEDGWLTLYYVFSEKEEAFLSGTIENGVITLRAQGMTSVYCMKGSEPEG